MKNLANCKPSEFLAQTFKIKKSVQEWLDVTEILKIRSNVPALKPFDGLSDEEKAKVKAENKKAIEKQVKANLDAMLDKVLSENADKTLEVLALCCFVEPENVDNYTMSEYLKCIGELLADESVMSFFTSLAQLAQKNMANVPNQ